MNLARFCRIALTCIIVVSLLSPLAYGVEKQIVAGAGPSTKITKLFFSEFGMLEESNGYDFVVMDGSVKHKGGILNSDKFLFGRTGRPLNEKESALGKEEIFLAKVPVAFVKGLEVDVSELSMTQVEKIFTRQITNWSEVGGTDAPILLVGREAGEALFMTLQKEYPFFKTVNFAKTFKKDHEVVKFLSSPLGKHAISFGAKPNFLEISLLNIKNFNSGVKVGLVYDSSNRNNTLVQNVMKYANSQAWVDSVKQTNMLPVK